MAGRRISAAAIAAGALLAVSSPASAQYGYPPGYGYPPSGGGTTTPSQSGSQPAANVKAEGNPFTPGSLKFDPKNVSVKVGQVVRWTNTDDTVPHTATEDHGLWDLTGTYGIPGNYGFGPGESRQRAFEAGTQHYYCKVHPEQMRGVVRVPVRLRVKDLDGGQRRIVIRWASKTPAAGRAFDVQIKRADGDWQSFRKATRDTHGGKTTHGTRVTWSARARFRRKDDASLHT